ncbi:MAG: sugar ABC transporter permease [Ruminococcaceae bacterium]|nr:sugar ABC transporter permease [Oscillospiraceae bacterium]
MSDQQTHLAMVKRKKKRKKILPYIMVLPAVVAYAMWCYYPFIKSIILSMTVANARGEIKKWVWFDNFIRLFKSQETWFMIRNTFEFAFLIGVGTFIIAMCLSLLSVNKVKGSRVYQTMYAIPMAVSSIAVANAFKQIYKKEGLLNALIGGNTEWLLNQDTAMGAVAVATIWCSVGASFLFLLVGFRNVPIDLLESSTVDGAGPIRRILSILIPCASPQIFFVIFLNINGSFKNFVMIRQLTGGGPNNATMVLIYDVFLNAMNLGRFETACAEGMILCVIIWIFQRIQFACEHKFVVY